MKFTLLIIVLLGFLQEVDCSCEEQVSCKACVRKGCTFILTSAGEECVSSVTGRKIKIRLTRIGECSIAAGIIIKIIVNH